MGAFTYLALLAARNIPMAALVTAPVITRHAAEGMRGLWGSRPRLAALMDPRAGGQSKPALNWALLALVLAAVALKAVDASLASTNERSLQGQVPLAAVEYLRDEQPAGPLFNAYNWGGYLTWRGWPDLKNHIDDRNEVQGQERCKRFFATMHAEGDWKQELADIDLVCIYPNWPLATRLAESPKEWVKVAGDRYAVAFARKAARLPAAPP